MKRGLQLILMLVLMLTFTAKTEAAEIVQQQGGIFNSPNVSDNKVKIAFKSGTTVKYIRHTKYLDNDFTVKAAFLQLKATTNFTGFAYNCPGYYITRAYSDSAGSNLIGYSYTYVKPTDINNTACQSLYTTGTKQPTSSINATHPVATVIEKSKMVPLTKTVTPSQPVTISNPTTIKSSDLTEVKEPTAAEMDAFFAVKVKKDSCLDSNFHALPKYMKKSGSSTWECVDYGNCLITNDYSSNFWYCSTSAIEFNETAEEPKTTSVSYDIPDYSYYSVMTGCDGDAANNEDCTRMQLLGNGEPLLDYEPESTYKEPETPVETPETPVETQGISACKGKYAAYGVLFNGVYQVPYEYSSSDVVTSGKVSTSFDYQNRLSVLFDEGSNFTLKIANSNTLTQNDFVNVSPCPTNEPIVEQPGLVENGLIIKSCRVDGTENQFKVELHVAEDAEVTGIPFFNGGNLWMSYPEENENVIITSDNRGNALFTLNTSVAHDFTLQFERSMKGEYYQSNQLSASQILNSSECSTTGEIEIPGETNGDPAPNCDAEPMAPECLPSCYCPTMDKYGNSLGFMCCVFECPGLSEIIEDFKGFLSEDLVGTATAPEVPTFEQDPPPNIFDVLNDVDTRNMPKAPTGENAPGLEDAGFTADDVKSAAPEIPVREDPTGGFNVTDPIESLPADGSTAPRPSSNNVGSPPTTGGSTSGNIGQPPTTGGTATPPTTGGTATPPNYSDSANAPTNYK